MKSKKMNVAFLLNKSVISGPNIVALSNARSLLALDIKVTVIFLYGDKEIEKEYPFLKSIDCLYLNASKKNMLSKVNTAINKYQIDIVHSHGFFPDFYNAFSKANVKFTTVHNIPHEDYLLRYGALKGKLLTTLHKLVMSKIKNIVCISETVCSVLPASFNKHVIYNPVREDFFALGYHKIKQVKKNPTFLYCGHFTSLKNPVKMITALKEIDKDFKMICLGDGPLLNECKAMVSSDCRFDFIGRTNNVPLYFQQSDFLLHFSKTEGFCLSVAEALVSGMEVIVNNIPIFHELKKNLDINEMHIVNNQNEIKSYIIDAIENFASDSHTHNTAFLGKYDCLKESFAGEKLNGCYRNAYAQDVL